MKPPFLFVPDVVDGGSYTDLGGAIGAMLEHACPKIATTANTTVVETYWNTGRYIVEYEQHGADRAKYGEDLIGRLSKDLTRWYGRGFSKTNVIYMRKLYLTFRKGETLFHFLTWSHYVLILKAADGLEIEFYCKECERSHWSVRELRRQLSNRIFVSRYQLYLPDKEQLRRELAYAIEAQESGIARSQKKKAGKR